MTPEALWEQLIDCINVEMAHADCREIDHITAALARAHAEGLEAGLRGAAAKCDEYERIQIENASHYERGGDGNEKHMAYAVVWSEAAAMLRALAPHLPAGEERPAAEEVKDD